jgi:hemerythrin-like domain-containing protein
MTAMTMDVSERSFAVHEHRDLAFGLAEMDDAIERATELSATDLWARLYRIMTWIEHDLRPHIAWEDAWLYARIDERAGTAWATRSARAEHRQIEGLATALEADMERLLDHRTPRFAADAIAHLSAIRAVIGGHLEREERLLLPLLEPDAEVD